MPHSNDRMLTGKPGRTLLAFCLPIFAGNMLQQLYSMVDSIVVGNYVSADALAAVGNAFPVVYMVICVSFGLSNGASILIGQYLGSGRSRELRALIRTSVVYSAAVAAALAGLCLLLSRPIIRLLDTPAAAFDDSLLYIRVYFLGLVFTFCFNMISAIFRALGDSRTPLLFLAASSVLNIALDLLFVLVLRLAVLGVAAATVLSQGAALALQLLVLKKRMLDYPRDADAARERIFDRGALAQLSKLALPTTAQELLISLNIFVTQRFVNHFGADVMAAYTVVGKIGDLGMMPMISMSIALTVFSAQNVGAGRVDRVGESFRAGLRFNLTVAGLLAAASLLFGRPLMQLFLGANGTQSIYAVGQSYLLYTAASFFIMAVAFASEGLIKGAGDVHVYFYIAVCAAVMKVAAALLLMGPMGSDGIWLAILLSWSVESALGLTRFLSGKWKDKGLRFDAQSDAAEV
ncbi:MAG: MATE family efflux transporter [Oscillospiraceae bacterium]|nr:MATE family efflux transporter [Oscillospiraceae bacterium]